jgi:phage-related baseplate assembly protein
MHHMRSVLHRPRAAHRRRAQAQPAFKGYGVAGPVGRLKALHTTAAVGIAVSPCMPGPCWGGVSWSSRTGSGSPRDPHQITTVSLT